MSTAGTVFKLRTAATHVEEMAELFGSEWLMVVFYGDESGTHGKGDYVISGYLSHITSWRLFRKVWERALAAPSPRPIKYLKMSEWQHRDVSKGHKGEFLGWSDIDAQLKLAHMVSVLGVMLNKGIIGEFTCSISWDLYNSCIDGDCKTVFNDPYYFNLGQITRQAVRSVKQVDPEFDGIIHFVFDSGNSAELDAHKHFAYIKRYAEPDIQRSIGSISFADDHNEPGLQVADLMAWHMRRHLAQIDGPDDFQSRTVEFLVANTGRFCRDICHEDGLRAYNRAVNEHMKVFNGNFFGPARNTGVEE